MMELELDNQAEHDENIPKVFESAGGFSPTIGIIGAVLGLIQVMQHLDDISEVGRGIAVAFVATIYGVGSANLFFLPVAGKITIRMKQEWTRREMMLEGVISILEGMNPRMIETKLMGFFSEANQDADKRVAREA
jgi:chemotaxis protein MotA